MKTQVTKMMVAGTRGGLGRILLTAFMLLAIVPLSVVSYLAIYQVRRNTHQAAEQQLNLIADSSALQIEAWLDAQHSAVLFLADAPFVRQAAQRGDWSDICSSFSQVHSPGVDLAAISMTSLDEQVAFCSLKVSGVNPQAPSIRALPAARLGISATVSPANSEHTAWTLVGYPDLAALEGILSPLLVGEDTQGYLLDGQNGQIVHCFAAGCGKSEDEVAVLVEDAERTVDEDPSGELMMGASRSIEHWPFVFLIEQAQETVRMRQEDLATMLIASTLAAALLTTLLAAAITRQLTRPIMDLTISAVKIAGGDLSQVVEVRRQDEIGILGRAFNVMTAELRSVYEGLEQKVAERTVQLTEANRRLRYQAMQLTLSAEIGRVATSILDLDALLDRVTQLIMDSFAYVYEATHVAIFLQDEFAEWLVLHTSKGHSPYPGEKRVAVDGNDLVGQAAADGQSRVGCLDQDGYSQVVVPLHIGPRAIGVFELRGHCGDNIDDEDINALESLGDQISVAIENARVYEAEREAVERLSRLDHVRLASLSAGSRELATALNNIIGFSRLILKGVDGPINELQRNDLVAIHKSGYHLLGLIDNVITLSELESGAIELNVQPVDMVELVDDVLAMARQRFVDVAFEWQDGRPSGVPVVQGDSALLRQAFMGLVIVAVEQIPQGTVAVQAVVCRTGWLVLSVGSSEWMPSAQACEDLGSVTSDLDESSVSLALGEQIVALHHGKMWAGFDMEYGWYGAVALSVEAPVEAILAAESLPEEADRRDQADTLDPADTLSGKSGRWGIVIKL
ncbi:MAG: HAMP domain-containing protein [Anaerolineae bacterium]|nr:HAMP domain-containing protein [Anaerolineae bacterium]